MYTSTTQSKHYMYKDIYTVNKLASYYKDTRSSKLASQSINIQMLQ